MSERTAQTLYVKVKDRDGNEVQKEVHIFAFWTDVRGGAIYLHESGIYGYKDGSPVRTQQELENIITQPTQLKYALLWWNSVGAKLSKNFYDQKAEEEEARIGQAMHVDSLADMAHLDLVQYQRRPVKERAEKAYSDPTSWSTWFTQRPDWWGLARTLEIGEWYFRRCDPESQGSEEGQAE